MKGRQYTLFPQSPEDIRKEVIQELGRVAGEDWEDFNEVVRYEVDARLKEMNARKPIPDYKLNIIIYK